MIITLCTSISAQCIIMTFAGPYCAVFPHHEVGKSGQLYICRVVTQPPGRLITTRGSTVGYEYVKQVITQQGGAECEFVMPSNQTSLRYARSAYQFFAQQLTAKYPSKCLLCPHVATRELSSCVCFPMAIHRWWPKSACCLSAGGGRGKTWRKITSSMQSMNVCQVY